MMLSKRPSGIKRLAVVGLMSMTLGFSGGCELGEFQTTSTVTMSGREVVSFLVRSLIFTPIESRINDAVDSFFDKVEDQD